MRQTSFAWSYRQGALGWRALFVVSRSSSDLKQRMPGNVPDRAVLTIGEPFPAMRACSLQSRPVGPEDSSGLSAATLSERAATCVGRVSLGAASFRRPWGAVAGRSQIVAKRLMLDRQVGLFEDEIEQVLCKELRVVCARPKDRTIA